MSPTDRRDLALSVLVSLLLLVALWAEPRPSDDLFIGLAGGRDVVAGRLGTPDDWSYTTEGRVWVNQNWGSHLLLSLSHAAAGPVGLLVVKGLLLAAATVFLALAARGRDAGWPLALLVAAMALTAGRSYVDLRPNLVGLVLATGLLATLTAAATRPVRVWLAAALLGVWANAHGSFVFGLGLLGLWTLTVGLMVPGALLPGLGALAAAGALAAFANPFGVTNLTHALVIGTSPAWRTVAEWVPLFTDEVTAFGSRWEVLTLTAVYLLLRVARLVVGRRDAATVDPIPAGVDAAAERGAAGVGTARGLALFDAAALLVVAIMAVRARRFVPLVLIVLAAPLAVEIAWWQRRRGSAWPTRVLAVGLAAAVALAAPPLVRRYRADNPVFRGYSTLERMLDAPTFPRGPVDFLRANGLGGRVYNAWEAEGYLRWSEAPVTVFIGGRAQQVYDEPILQLHKDLRAGQTSPQAALAPYQVGLAILPLTAQYANPLGQLVYAEDSAWTYAYCDGRHVVLVDTSHPEVARIVPALEGGTLAYPSPAIAATSRMMYLASPRAGAEIEVVRAAAEEAARLAPTALAYAVIGDLALSVRTSAAPTRTYLAAERERLATLAADEGPSLALAQARLAVARTEAVLYSRIVDPEGLQRAKDALALRQREMHDLLATWAYGWDPNVF